MCRSGLVPLETVGRIEAVCLGEAEPPGVCVCQLQQTVQGPYLTGQDDSDGPESTEGCGREPEVQLIIMRIILSRAGLSSPGRSEMHAMRCVQT